MTSWLDVRKRLRASRFELAHRAVEHYPDAVRLAGTPLLTRAEWVPERPLPLSAIDLEYRECPPPPSYPAPVPPGFAGYSDAMAALDAPTVFENRPTYRLLEADLSGERGRLVFGPGRYFDGIDTGEAAAHELATGGPTPLRTAIGDPCDLSRRGANLAVSALTVRAAGVPTMLLHWRDPAKVGHAGGMYQVVPVGVFQPPHFSLWHSMLREFAEELLGEPERDEVDPAFAAAMTEALDGGGIRAHCLGLGVDPLTFATDLLVSVVIKPPVFDALFTTRVATNDEGEVTEHPFTPTTIANLPMQPAGAALIHLALP